MKKMEGRKRQLIIEALELYETALQRKMKAEKNKFVQELRRQELGELAALRNHLQTEEMEMQSATRSK